VPTLRLDRTLYPRPALEQAAAAFTALARIELHAAGAVTVVHFRDLAEGAAERIADEFTNFALVCAVERARAGGEA